jgi:hypothetical protein
VLVSSSSRSPRSISLPTENRIHALKHEQRYEADPQMPVSEYRAVARSEPVLFRGGQLGEVALGVTVVPELFLKDGIDALL